MHSIQQPIINQTMFGPLLQPRDRYQRIWDEFIKRNLEVIAMHDWQLRDVAIRDTIRKIYPAYNTAFYDGLSSIRECISKYHGPTTYRTVLNSIHIDCETDRKNIKAAEKVAKNWWHQQWRVWDELFTHHITHLRTFDDPNDPHTLIRRDQVIHLLLNTTIKLAPQAKEHWLLKSSTLLKATRLHLVLNLNIKALKERLSRQTSPETSADAKRLILKNLVLEQLNQNWVPVQSNVTRSSRNVQHHVIDAHNPPFENAVNNVTYEGDGGSHAEQIMLEWTVEQNMQRIAVETQATQLHNGTNLRDDSSSDESHPALVFESSLQEPSRLSAAPAPVPFDFDRDSTWGNTAQYDHAPPPIEYRNVHDGNHTDFVQQHRFSPYDMPSPMLYRGGAHAEPFNQYF
eukprot:734740_1